LLIPLVIVMVTGLVPLPEHEPEPAIDTARPEDALAATGNVELYVALAGAGVPTVIDWLASEAVVVS
jgi:hypothetical protein